MLSNIISKIKTAKAATINAAWVGSGPPLNGGIGMYVRDIFSLVDHVCCFSKSCYVYQVIALVCGYVTTDLSEYH